MVRSPEADTIYLSSKSTTLTAARCPTRTRRRLMSVGEAMSQTAIDRSFEQVTIRPLAKRRWRTASLWWISVFSTSPVVTSHTLQRRQDMKVEEGGQKKEKVQWKITEWPNYEAQVTKGNKRWNWRKQNGNVEWVEKIKTKKGGNEKSGKWWQDGRCM